MALGDLLIRLAADTAQLQSDMGKAVHIAQSHAQRMQAAVAGAQEKIASAAGIAQKALLAVGLAAGGAAGVGAFSGIIRGLSALDDAAERTGASVEKLSGLANIAAVGGNSLEQLEQPLIRLSKALADNDEKATAAKAALQALGLNAAQLRDLDPADALLEVAKRLDNFRDGTGKTAAALALFGKSGAQALPILKDLAQATDSLRKVTAEEAAAAEQFEKDLKAIALQSESTKRALVSDMLPALTEISAAMREAAKDGGLLNAIWVGLGGAAANALGATDRQRNAARVADIDKQLDVARRQLESGTLKPPGASDSFFSFLIPDIRLGADAVAKIRATVDRLEEEKKRLATVAAPPAAPKPDVPFRGVDLPKTERERDSQFQNAIKQLEQEAAKVADLTRFEEVLRGVRAGHYGAITEAQQQRLLDLAAEVDVQRDLVKQEREREAGLKALGDERMKAAEQETQRLNQIKESTLDALDGTRAWTRAVQDLVAVYERGWITAEQLAKASLSPELRALLEPRKTSFDVLYEGLKEGDISLDQYTRAVERLRDKTEESNDAARELGLTFSSAFESAVIGGKKLSDVLQGLSKDVSAIFLRKSVTEPLAEGASKLFKESGLGKGFGDFFKGLFGGSSDKPLSAGAQDIHAFNLDLVGEFADGGFVPRTGLALVHAGEEVIPAGGSRGQVFIDARGADQAAIARLEQKLLELHYSIEPRAVAAVSGARRRGM